MREVKTGARNNEKPRILKINLMIRGFLVQLTGLEPEPTYVDMNLNHARMPIPPQLHYVTHQRLEQFII